MAIVTKQYLLSFEEEIAADFAAKKIAAPVHLAGGNENELISVFWDINPWDWVLCSWRSHWHCLLKGVPREEVKEAILDGRSIALCFPEHKILCSAIVGGIAPIAVGIAWSIKNKLYDNQTMVHCFIGDMTSECGVVHESMKYAARHDLPVRFIIEDNGKSVCSDTKETWGLGADKPDITRYSYQMTKPHCGVGEWIRF